MTNDEIAATVIDQLNNGARPRSAIDAACGGRPELEAVLTALTIADLVRIWRPGVDPVLCLTDRGQQASIEMHTAGAAAAEVAMTATVAQLLGPYRTWS